METNDNKLHSNSGLYNILNLIELSYKYFNNKVKN